MEQHSAFQKKETVFHSKVDGIGRHREADISRCFSYVRAKIKEEMPVVPTLPIQCFVKLCSELLSNKLIAIIYYYNFNDFVTILKFQFICMNEVEHLFLVIVPSPHLLSCWTMAFFKDLFLFIELFYLTILI